MLLPLLRMPAGRRLRRTVMNRYSQMLMEFSRQNRPRAFAQIDDPDAFFVQADKEIQAEIDAVRVEMVGPQKPDESAEAFQSRSSQASATAEELVLSDHWLLQPEPAPEEDLRKDADPEVVDYYRDLEAISSVTNDRDW
jgi:hypothetical protein